MAVYSYKARDPLNNKVVRSTIQADSEAAAAKLLMAQHLVPIHIAKVEEGAFLSRFSNHVTKKELVVMTRQLSTMLNAGLPLSQSLSTVAGQTSGHALKNMLSDVLNNINGGASLADSLAKYPDTFNTFFVSIVRAGEASGKLDTSLERLANQLEHDADMLSKIRGAMVYPAIVLVVIVSVVIYMLVTLVPQVRILYEDMHKTLPFQTLILQAVADFTTHYWYITLLILLGAGVTINRWKKTQSGKRTFDALKLNAPLFSPLVRKLYMARFSRTMQTLVQSGVSIIESLQISADSVSNLLVRDDILAAIGPVKNGKAVSEALSDKDYIMPFVPQMLKIGESSGSIDNMLGKIADYYDKEVDNAIKSISTLIEPILMVIMALLIGFIVVSVLLPIYQLSTSIQR